MLFSYAYNVRGLTSRNWPIGVTALWLVVLLGGYLLLYY